MKKTHFGTIQAAQPESDEDLDEFLPSDVDTREQRPTDDFAS